MYDPIDSDEVKRSANRERLFFLGLLCMFVLLAFTFQGSRGIYSPDEGYYVSIALDMIETGDWMIPRIDHQPWLDKPPFTMWGIASGILLFGQHEWGARFFHAIYYLITILIVFFLGKTMGGRKIGFRASLIYSTMLMPFIAANVITPDTPLTLWTTASCLAFWMVVRDPPRRTGLWILLLGVVLGFGFLTKSIAALIPGGAMVAFLLFRRHLWRRFLNVWTLAGFAAFTLIGLSWFVFVSKSIPGALAYFLDNQVVGRTVSTTYARNPGLLGTYVYLLVLTIGTLPWSFVWVYGLQKRIRNWKQNREPVKMNSSQLLLTLWIAIPLTVFFLANSRLPFYLLPLFPAMALLTAIRWPFKDSVKLYAHSPSWLTLNRSFVVIALIVTSLLSLKVAGAYYSSHENMRIFYNVLKTSVPSNTCEIVSVNEHMEGLSLYFPGEVERVTTGRRTYPFFTKPESLEEEISEILQEPATHVLVGKRGEDRKTIQKELEVAGIPYRVLDLPFQHYIFICYPENQALSSLSPSL